MEISLAIECSSAQGSVALGRGSEMLECQSLNRIHRHGVNLMPVMDAMFKKFDLKPMDLDEIYVSVGPGSFTGLRIAVALAKTLSRVTGAEIYPIPTLDVVVENADPAWPQVAIGLNAKRGQMFTGLYSRDENSTSWQMKIAPSLLSPEALMEQVEGDLWVIGDVLPAYDWPAQVTLADQALATPSAGALWKLGQARKAEMDAVDPLALEPLYVRLPEAEEKWLAAQA